MCIRDRCKIYLYFAPVCWVRLPNDSQKDNCDGIPQDPVRVREELHLQNVPLPVHQQLFELNLHSIFQGSILHRPRRRKCQIQLHFKVDFILKDWKYKTIATPLIKFNFSGWKWTNVTPLAVFMSCGSCLEFTWSSVRQHRTLQSFYFRKTLFIVC